MLVLVFLYLFVPLLGTTIYSFSTTWNQTVLPEGLTFKWYSQLFTDTRFLQSFGRSLLLSLGSTVVALVLIVPAVFSIVLYLPKLERLVQSLLIMTYAMPGIILAVALIKTYSNSGISMVLIVGAAYVVSLLPYIYQATRNSLRTIHAADLMAAAEILGASRLKAFLYIIVPNIYPGLLVASLLSFSILFGEFVLINIIVGSRFETIQIYLYSQLSKSGHIASAIVVFYFSLMTLVTVLLVRYTRKKKAIG
ncbi:ABC transporter permease [Bacillus alkalicellulosilyticus]|uniref:ABC transporter permease n=1 Tax=Alkalihalobacterium alkalicellulosilyticum TaxID=1912214 RepID=UPI00099836E7|nr:ABC transporter permease subunit [Bacillus alkalicellulosilyticus]